MSRLSFFLVGLFALLSYAQAAQTFVGCVSSTLLATTADASSIATNKAACDSRCAGLGYQYSYFQSSGLVGAIITTPNCYCDAGNSYVAATTYVVPAGGVVTGGDTNCIPDLQAQATDLSTTFVFQNCVGTLTGVTVNLVSGTILGGSIVDSPHACFQQCRGNLQAYFIPIVPTLTSALPSYGCVCTPSGVGQSITCGVGQFYRYSHAASASGQARRRLQEAMQAETVRRKSFCPGSMVSCNVPGVADSWECVDPTSDLESCGGCVYGDYTAQGHNTTATGQDCTQLPGVRMGGSTCTAGKCEIFSCKKGWTLRDGACVRK
ncbi:hypothetical protein IAU60_001311 [Kwoniella sp. DSM 27419]